MNHKEITDKDWLDLSWKYFQQHAQQRVQYLNYFILFSAIITTGLTTSLKFGENLRFVGIGIGILQSFLAFIFLKIDLRNKFLTKHAENNIISFELAYQEKFNTKNLLFTSEKSESENKCTLSKWNLLKYQYSHGQLYKIIFITFIAIGGIEVLITISI